jgi:D-tagatose-1,6-bisphosphate aldolase subunit GatZ/KbaZ
MNLLYMDLRQSEFMTLEQRHNPVIKSLSEHKKNGTGGIYSICSSNPYVLQAALGRAQNSSDYVLIESTSNQVNQFGGYTGLTPSRFAAQLHDLADSYGLPPEQVILGGDHLGPNAWQSQPAADAMEKAQELVHDCVLAGYTKLHLDASMKLGDDNLREALDPALAAQRTAQLCLAAEMAFTRLPSGSKPPCYVIGTEVPPPGGAKEAENSLSVTRVDDARQTIELTRAAFKHLGLEAAWERVVALVVQPGVEFGDQELFIYDRKRAVPLAEFIVKYERLVYEAHSTDYQPRSSLKELVEDHFAILKVGPALTFAFREAVFALSWLEEEWLGGREDIQLSNLPLMLEEVMLAKPEHWRRYYHGDEDSQKFARRYSLSDRARYYWPDPRLQAALNRLFSNLSKEPVPKALVSQFLPNQYEKLHAGLLTSDPHAWVEDKIACVLDDYTWACHSMV